MLNAIHKKIEFKSAGKADICSMPLLMQIIDCRVYRLLMNIILRCAVTVAFELVKTLGYLKWQRVIHSDLKPENVLVSTKGDDIGMNR